jgi:hypothetical protein
MRGCFITRGILFGIIIILILTSIIPAISIKTITQTNEKNNSTLLPSMPEKTISITFYFFGRTGFEKQTQVVSSQEATKIYILLQELKQEGIAQPFSEKIHQLKKELTQSLKEPHFFSLRIIEEINTILPPLRSKTLSRILFFEKTNNNILTIQTNITRFLCGVGSQGVGTILPLIQIPRPRLFGLWIGSDESSTSIISFLPYGGATASGKQMGIALGFIGIGASFAFPEAPIYVLFGYAILIHITANSIEIFP